MKKSFCEGILRFPLQIAVCFCRIGIGFHYIARPAWSDPVIKPYASSLFEDFEQLKNGNGSTGAQVENAVTVGDAVEVLHCFKVCDGYVHNMDEIAKAGAVGRIIVVAENCKLLSFA